MQKSSLPLARLVNAMQASVTLNYASAGIMSLLVQNGLGLQWYRPYKYQNNSTFLSLPGVSTFISDLSLISFLI